MGEKRFPYTFLAYCGLPAAVWIVVAVAVVPLTDSYEKSKKKNLERKFLPLKGFFNL